MNTVLIVLAFVLVVAGIVGSVAPGLPGPPVSWAGLLVASFTPFAAVGGGLLVGAAVVAAVITVVDYVVPSVSTRRFGGSKYGVWGCNLGLVLSLLGLPFGPQGIVGVVLWPFVGALAGEYVKQHDFGLALRAAWGAFVGFLSGTLLKLAYCIALLVVLIAALV